MYVCVYIYLGVPMCVCTYLGLYIESKVYGHISLSPPAVYELSAMCGDGGGSSSSSKSAATASSLQIKHTH